MFRLRNCLLLASALNNPAKLHLRTRFTLKRRAINPNVGVRHQIAGLELKSDELKANQNLLDNLEKSFWDTDQVLDAHEKEHAFKRKMVGLHTVKRKYFKDDPSPNMLTWAEREEICALHLKDPDHWTATRLAHSFPASPPIIMKILRSSWKMRTSQAIEKHDKRVLKNWQLLREGKLEVPDETLKKHLLTFTQLRKLSHSDRTSSEIAMLDSPLLNKKGAFSKIYDSYKKLKGEAEVLPNEETDDPIRKGLSLLSTPPVNDTFIVPRQALQMNIRTQKPMTMETMQEHLLKEGKHSKKEKMPAEKEFMCAYLEENKKNSHTTFRDPVLSSQKLCEAHQAELGKSSIGENIDSLVDSSSDQFQNCREENIESDIGGSIGNTLNSFTEGVRDSDQKEEKSNNVTNHPELNSIHTKSTTNPPIAVSSYISQLSKGYPLKIKVPKQAWKKGGVYQVNDRFYADDGEFLYRVPGLL